MYRKANNRNVKLMFLAGREFCRNASYTHTQANTHTHTHTEPQLFPSINSKFFSFKSIFLRSTKAKDACSIKSLPIWEQAQTMCLKMIHMGLPTAELITSGISQSSTFLASWSNKGMHICFARIHIMVEEKKFFKIPVIPKIPIASNVEWYTCQREKWILASHQLAQE